MTKRLTTKELHERIVELEKELEEYIKTQRKRDTSIFLALLSAVISAAVKYMFTV